MFVVELVGLVIELMVIVIGGLWLYVGVQCIVVEYLCEIFVFDVSGMEIQQCGYFW